MRNIVYYSPTYPGFKKNIEGIKQFYYGDEAKDFGVAHLALCYVYAGRPSDLATWGGTYTVKETVAPPGYAKDTETYTVNVVSEETTTFTAKDEPITDFVQLMLTKNPVGYPHDHGEGDATLKGAVYEFKYYDGQYETAAKAEASGTPTATWNLVTDANGMVLLGCHIHMLK